MRAVLPRSSSAATALERAAIVSKSTAITRASISPVTPGIVAPRAPASVARLRAVVWLSDRLVGAVGRPLVHHGQDGVGRRLRSLLAQRLADGAGCGVHDHQHVLAGLDGQASVDDGADGWSEVGHGRLMICLW